MNETRAAAAGVLAFALLVAASCESLTSLESGPWRPESAPALGRAHTCALASDGLTYCWGEATQAALGNALVSDSTCLSNGSTRPCRARPVAVNTATRFVELSAASYNTCGVDDAGDIWCWGSGDGVLPAGGQSAVPVRITSPAKFAQIAVGMFFACALSTESKILCWGQNSVGQLGAGDQTFRGAPTAISGNMDFRMVAVGIRHACGLAIDDRAYCWGMNATGQLGIGTPETTRFSPVLVTGDHRFSVISSGGDRTCGIASDNVTWCWGGTRDVEDSLNTRAPVEVPGGIVFRTISVGSDLSCGISTQRATHCWGTGPAPLGNGNANLTPSATPQLVAGSHLFLSVDVGERHACGITSADMWCWGYAHQGQLTETAFPESCFASDEFYRCTAVPVRVARP
jgi:alpha-tubulin suppressor-like RCC1 family protein